MLACTRGEDTGNQELFLVDTRDAGIPLADGQGYQFDPQRAAFGFEHVVPGVVWGNSPSTEMILLLWEYAQAENISDPGICPFATADGATTTWNTACRSAEGYDWTGTVSKVAWEESGHDWEHWTFDLLIESDRESRKFDSISLQGEYFFAGSNPDLGLLSHTQSNYVIDARGYWSTSFKEDVEPAWHGMAVTGTWETWTDGTLVFAGLMDLGELEGFAFSTPGLQEVTNCVREPKGSMTMSNEATAELVFEGAGQCDGCAQFTLDGERQNTACDQSYL